MKLQTLIEKLRELPEDGIVAYGFGEPGSYRGHYEQLAFLPVENVSVLSMIKHAKSAVGIAFQSYKGGCYTMTMNTVCWIAAYGGLTDDPITDMQIARWRIECTTNDTAVDDMSDEDLLTEFEESRSDTVGEIAARRTMLHEILDRMRPAKVQESGSKPAPVNTPELRQLAHGLQTDGDDREPHVMRSAADEIDALRSHLKHVIDQADILDEAIRGISLKCEANKTAPEDVWISPVEQGRMYLSGKR